MAFPITISCPSCQAKLKIQDASAVGKRVRCPRCDTAIIVQDPADSLAETAEQDFGFENDFGPPQSAAGGARRRSASAGTARGGRKSPPSRKRKAAAPAWQKPVIIGGAVLGLCLLVGVLVLAFGKGGKKGADGNVVDMTYLPANTEALVYVEVQPWLQHPKFKQKIESEAEYQRNSKEFENATGITFDDIASVTIGTPGTQNPGAGSPDESAIFVVRTSKDVDEGLVAGASDTETREHSGTTYYVVNGDKVCFFFPDARTAVGGSEAALKQAIDRGTTSARREKFDFIAGDHSIFMAYAPADVSALRNSTGMTPDDVVDNPLLQKFAPKAVPHLRELADVGLNHLSGGGLGVKIAGSNFEIEVFANCSDNKAASRATTAGQGFVKELKDLYNAFRVTRSAEIQSVADPLVASLTVKQSSTAMVLELSIPDDLDEQIERATGGGGGGGFPNPFGNGNPFKDLNLFGGTDRVATANRDITKITIKSVEAAATMYAAEHLSANPQGISYPESLNVLLNPLDSEMREMEPYLDSIPQDAWGNDLQYEFPNTKVAGSKEPAIWSTGPNGRDEGGGGDDINNWDNE